jgi:hypothetical protein
MPTRSGEFRCVKGGLRLLIKSLHLMKNVVQLFLGIHGDWFQEPLLIPKFEVAKSLIQNGILHIFYANHSVNFKSSLTPRLLIKLRKM